MIIIRRKTKNDEKKKEQRATKRTKKGKQKKSSPETNRDCLMTFCLIKIRTISILTEKPVKPKTKS